MSYQTLTHPATQSINHTFTHTPELPPCCVLLCVMMYVCYAGGGCRSLRWFRAASRGRAISSSTSRSPRSSQSKEIHDWFNAHDDRLRPLHRQHSKARHSACVVGWLCGHKCVVRFCGVNECLSRYKEVPVFVPMTGAPVAQKTIEVPVSQSVSDHTSQAGRVVASGVV